MGVLHSLILDLFGAGEFRRWLFLHGAEGILSGLPAEMAGDAVFVEKALEALTRRGQIDDAFFAGLVAERPRRADEIWEVAKRWAPTTDAGPREETTIRLGPQGVEEKLHQRPTPVAQDAGYVYRIVAVEYERPSQTVQLFEDFAGLIDGNQALGIKTGRIVLAPIHGSLTLAARGVDIFVRVSSGESIELRTGGAFVVGSTRVDILTIDDAGGGDRIVRVILSDRSETLMVPRAGLVIGRNGDALSFDDPLVSRAHARLTASTGGVVITDTDSANGVYVRRRLDTLVLPHASSFFLEGKTFRVEISSK